jgi:hypothetical protein
MTVSIHGHTAKLQDRLVGVKGAFDKAIQGIRNVQALSGGKTVINIDIVINKQNIPYLRETIDLFRGMGIHEFDLLYIVPFGRGFAEYRSQLYFNMDDHHDDLQRALEVSREPGVFIWTNRLPPQHLEGYEDLIQDPHKLHSEIQGGLHNFEGFMKMGVAPDCHGERCDHCFLKSLCHDHMFEYRDRLGAGSFERVRIELDEAPASAAASAVLDRQRPRVLHVRGADVGAVRGYLAQSPYREVEGLSVVAEVADEAAGAGALVAQDGLGRVRVTTVAGLEAAAAALAARVDGAGGAAGSPELEVRLSSETAAWLLEHRARLGALVAAGLVVGHLPNFEYVSEVRENGVEPAVLAALGEAGYRLMNVTPCLGGAKTEAGAHYEISREMLDAHGKMKVSPYVQRYIMGEYYKKSVRCRGCMFDASCKGMHIQYLRSHGFRVLAPIAGEAPAAHGAQAQPAAG